MHSSTSRYCTLNHPGRKHLLVITHRSLYPARSKCFARLCLYLSLCRTQCSVHGRMPGKKCHGRVLVVGDFGAIWRENWRRKWYRSRGSSSVNNVRRSLPDLGQPPKRNQYSLMMGPRMVLWLPGRLLRLYRFLSSVTVLLKEDILLIPY